MHNNPARGVRPLALACDASDSKAPSTAACGAKHRSGVRHLGCAECAEHVLRDRARGAVARRIDHDRLDLGRQQMGLIPASAGGLICMLIVLVLAGYSAVQAKVWTGRHRQAN